MLKIHLFIIFTIKTPQPLAALDPLGLLNRDDTDKCTLNYNTVLQYMYMPTHLSGNISTINPSMETIGCSSGICDDCRRFCIRSWAPFNPAVNPTG